MGIDQSSQTSLQRIDHGDQSTFKRPMGDPIGNVPWQRLIHGAYKMCGAASPTIVSSSATRTNRQQQGHHCRQQGLIGHHRVRPLYRDQLTIRRLEDLHLLQEEVRSQSAATAHFSRHLYCLWNKPRQQGSINRSIDRLLQSCESLPKRASTSLSPSCKASIDGINGRMWLLSHRIPYWYQPNTDLATRIDQSIDHCCVRPCTGID